MLGDNAIYGQFELTIDDKNRVIIPAKTGVEKGEEIVIYTENGDRYIDDKKRYTKKIQKILDRIENPMDLKQYKKDLELMRYFSDAILADVTVDGSHRIRITDIEDIRGNNTLEVCGAGNRLRIVNATKAYKKKTRLKKA